MQILWDQCFNNRVIQGKSPLLSLRWRLFPITHKQTLFSGAVQRGVEGSQIEILSFSLRVSCSNINPSQQSRLGPFLRCTMASLMRAESVFLLGGLLGVFFLIIIPANISPCRLAAQFLIQENNYLGVNIFNEFSSVIAFQPTSFPLSNPGAHYLIFIRRLQKAGCKLN